MPIQQIPIHDLQQLLSHIDWAQVQQMVIQAIRNLPFLKYGGGGGT